MKYRIRYLPKAVVNRNEIKIYLSQFYPSTAGKFFAMLKEKTARLKEFPYSCPAYEYVPDYRVLVVGDYLVFYVVNEEAKLIEVHRILHSSQDINQHLQ